MINFVSNLPRNLRSGGFSALNTAAFGALNKLCFVHYAGPINPAVILWQKALSKVLRLAGSRGDFVFFSQRRLGAIAREVHAQCVAEAQLDFFHGITPWALTQPLRPYVALSDCTFRDYVEIFHRREHFRHDDLERIEQAEAAWLKNARRVLFTSDWATERAVSYYMLDASRVSSVGIFGELDLPPRDAYAGGKEFAFVATNFEAKGGRTVLAAFRELRKRHPDAGLIVVGRQPSDVVAEPGVNFAGFLRKEIPDEYGLYQQILSRVRAIVHPTRSDIAPLVIIEAGNVGCPAISSRRFAIPELIDDGRTGFLLDNSSQVSAVVSAMSWMLEHENEYQQMRKAAWAKARGQHSKEQFEERLLASLREEAIEIS
jgi:glycosyltransferase involved in cell wall biosynthesis